MRKRSMSPVLGLALLALLVTSGCRQESLKTEAPDVAPAGWPAFVDSSPDSAALYRDSRHLFDYDREAPLEIVEVARRREGALTLVDLTYASPRGGTVPATLIEPPAPGPFAGVVLQHGRPSNRQAQIGLGEIYAHMGAVVVLIDAPFARPGRASQRPLTLTARDRDEQIQLIVDLRRAIDLLEGRKDVDPDRLAYVGVSFGGAMGGLLAGVESRLRAYVLVKGDGGPVEHMMFNRGRPGSFRPARSEKMRRWITAMWPIEPIHYVAQARPAALLFQNGTRDIQVPPPLALSYQRAGSEPKTVLWYRAGHSLPVEHVVDQLEWLRDRIGIRDVDSLPRVRLFLMAPAESFVRLHPDLQGLARGLDWAMLLWFGLVAGSLLIVAWELSASRLRGKGVAANWLLAVAFFGPFGLLVQRALGPKKASPDSPPTPPAARALGSTLWCVAGRLTGLIGAIAILDRWRQLYGSPLVVLLLVAGLPFATGWGMHRLARVAPGGDPQRPTVFQRTVSAHLISNNLVVTAALPTAGVLVSKWLYRWYPIPGWQVASPPFWAIACLAAFAAGLLSYPAELWLLRWGRVEWGLASRAGALEPSQARRLAIGGVVLLSFLTMLVGFHLTFGFLL